MNTYRVFVERHYIAVCYFDVEAETEKKAKHIAERSAYKLYEDPRSTATDNGWHVEEETVELPFIGYDAIPFQTELFHQIGKSKAYIEKREVL